MICVVALVMVLMAVFGAACTKEVISSGGSAMVGSNTDVIKESGASTQDGADAVTPDSLTKPDLSEQSDMPVNMIGVPKDEFKSENVDIDRMEHTITNENGEIITTIYFELPRLKGDSNAIRKINAYFQAQYENWLSSKGDRLSYFQDDGMSDFQVSVKRYQKIDSDKPNRKPSPSYDIRTYLAFEDGKIISFEQIVFNSTLDTMFSGFGVTFDMETGELLPLTHFFDVDPAEFREGLRDFLLADTRFQSNAINEFFDTNTSDFLYEYRGHEWDLSYEYYYDGITVWLALNQIDGYMGIAWNANADPPFFWPIIL
jgi:hypothetical protein